MVSVRRHSERKKQGQGGFTLIELVAVIIVLGVLASLAVPRFAELRTSAELAGLATTASSEANALVARAGQAWSADGCDEATGSGLGTVKGYLENLEEFNDYTIVDGSEDGPTGTFSVPGSWDDADGFNAPFYCQVEEE